MNTSTFNLAPYAADASRSRGRRHFESPPRYRSEYQRDRDRIVHCAAFRRLEYKTQVFVNHEGDMFRTRLTHSLEVAQIGRSVARALKLNEDLVEAIALAHDLGHTPFGHAGQDALHECMKEYGGFEHNLQSLRVVDELEEKYAEFPGLNLTFEAREGILKHCHPSQVETLGDVAQRFAQGTQPSLEAQLANLADEIAYNNHDVDDGLRAGLITLEQLRDVALFEEQYRTVRQQYPKLSQRRTTHEIVRRMINRQVNDLIDHSGAQIKACQPETIEDIRQHSAALIRYSDEIKIQNVTLKRFLRQHLYSHYRVNRMSVKAKNIIRSLFSIFMEEPQLLPPEALIRNDEEVDLQNVDRRARTIADYIAGMTDRYAIDEYNRLFLAEQRP